MPIKQLFENGKCSQDQNVKWIIVMDDHLRNNN